MSSAQNRWKALSGTGFAKSAKNIKLDNDKMDLEKIEKQFVWLLIIIVALNIFDIILTILGIHSGAKEINVLLVRLFANSISSGIYTKMLIVCISLILFHLLFYKHFDSQSKERKLKRLILLVTLIVAIISALLVLWNLFVLWVIR
jgi:hypothetical protein